MKINVGIVGYGNLGKAVEQTVLASKNLNLIAIFSRRNVVSKFNIKIEPYERFIDYKNKIDIMLLCGGSKDDLEWQTAEIVKHFDIINTFDTHKKIAKEYKKIDGVSKKSNHRALICCGWDPGVFSMVRTLFQAIGKNSCHTFWGKGISMGHSDAIRRIPNVDDGIQFTIPNKDAIKMIKAGKFDETIPMHTRECFVVAEKQHHASIEKNIKNIPNYFKGQPTKVHFVSREKLLKLKSNISHKGHIFSTFKTTGGSLCNLELNVSMKSNPEFTASIMCAYTIAVINLKKQKQIGCFTNIDIPVSYLYSDNQKDKIFREIF